MNPNQQMIRIPIPTDSYDQTSCDQATISSIKMLITTFDTTMDSFHESIDKLSSRLDVLGQRTMKLQHRILEDSKKNVSLVGADGSEKNEREVEEEKNELSNENMSNIRKVSFPVLYDHATQMKDVTSSLYKSSSAIMAAKQKANEAIKRLLLEELTQDSTSNEEEEQMKNSHDNNCNQKKEDSSFNYLNNDIPQMMTCTTSTSATAHSAKPSDEWLDRPSAFEERSNSKIAMQIHTVPPLILHENSVQMFESALYSNLKSSSIPNCQKEIQKKLLLEETNYYKNGLEEIEEERHHSEKKSNVSHNANNAVVFDASSIQQHSTTNNSLTLDYYDDNMSVISDYTRGVATTIGGYGGGVGVGNETHTIISSSYSTLSHGASSASRRRRQRKIMALAEATTSPSRRERIMKDSQQQFRMQTQKDQHHQKQNQHQRHYSKSSGKNVPMTSVSGSRQQALSGSIPYVCDLIHDSFGLIDRNDVSSSKNNNLIVESFMKKAESKMNASSRRQREVFGSGDRIKGRLEKNKISKRYNHPQVLNVLSEESENQ